MEQANNFEVIIIGAAVLAPHCPRLRKSIRRNNQHTANQGSEADQYLNQALCNISKQADTYKHYQDRYFKGEIRI